MHGKLDSKSYGSQLKVNDSCFINRSKVNITGSGKTTT